MTIFAKDYNRRIPVQYNPIALTDSLFDLYNTMLAHEGSTEAMAQMARTKICSSVDQQRYTRAGVAALFRLVKNRIKVDDHIADDRSLIVDDVQEWYMHLHLFSVWTSSDLQGSP